MGIDVGKTMLDVCVLPGNRPLCACNDENGHQLLIEDLRRLGAYHVVLQAMGRYHVELHQSLDAGGLTVSVVNPYRSRKFADISGQLAKTDKIDAKLLAHFGLVMKPPGSVV